MTTFKHSLSAQSSIARVLSTFEYPSRPNAAGCSLHASTTIFQIDYNTWETLSGGTLMHFVVVYIEQFDPVRKLRNRVIHSPACAALSGHIL